MGPNEDEDNILRRDTSIMVPVKFVSTAMLLP